jgi:hypothetical protein
MDRLRWDNIARAAAVLAVAALVVAWPHLKGAPPALPPAAATPVSVEDPALSAPPQQPAVEPAPIARRPKPRPKPERGPKHKHSHHRARRARAAAPPRAAPAPPVSAAPVAPPPRGPSASDMAAHEFAVP